MASPRVCSQCGRDYIDCECFGVARPTFEGKFPSRSPQAERGADRAGAASLSFSHNSDGMRVHVQPDLAFRLTGSQAKTKFALEVNAEEMIRKAGIERCGFLTLTVGDDGQDGFRQVWDASEASRRINNASRRLFPELFERWITVTERHKSGAIHFHLLVVMASGADIRSGFNFDAVRFGGATKASAPLRAVWEILRERLPGLGFGRAQLTPIEKSGSAVATYVAKYVEKNLFNRLPEDKGKKLVRYGGFERHVKANDFGWCTARATAWRKKAEELAGLAGVSPGVAGRDEVAQCFGPRWAFGLSRIMRVVDDRPLPAFEWTSPHERECARQFVLRIASSRWVLRRVIRNSESPIEWSPDWEALNEARATGKQLCFTNV